MIDSLLIKKELLVYLSQRERQVIEMRYGLLDGRKMTLQAIGDVFGVCRERIRQIERKALRKLKHPSRIKKGGETWFLTLKKEQQTLLDP